MYLQNFFICCFAFCFLVSVAVLSVLGSSVTHSKTYRSANIEAGRARSADCSTCHGKNGNSINPSWPNLAGQNADYLILQLNAFKEGSRQSELMEGVAGVLSDQDIEDLAIYYESLN